MSTVISVLATIAYIAVMVSFHRRLEKLEGRKPVKDDQAATGLGVKQMQAQEDAAAMLVGLRARFVDAGFSEETADALVLAIMRGAANSAGKK